jgi:hypothetical protein
MSTPHVQAVYDRGGNDLSQGRAARTRRHYVETPRLASISRDFVSTPPKVQVYSLPVPPGSQSGVARRFLWIPMDAQARRTAASMVKRRGKTSFCFTCAPVAMKGSGWE